MRNGRYGISEQATDHVTPGNGTGSSSGFRARDCGVCGTDLPFDARTGRSDWKLRTNDLVNGSFNAVAFGAKLTLLDASLDEQIVAFVVGGGERRKSP